VSPESEIATDVREMQRLLRESFEIALERDDDFPRLFYDVLFYRHPEVEALFGERGRGQNTPDAQRRMFGQTLIAIVDHVDDPAWLEATLIPMGRTHVDYGVTEPMYDYVGDALMTAFAEVCAGDWTSAHERAWRQAYAIIAETMLRGAR
jgi:hemoglobin-like flavoprotein